MGSKTDYMREYMREYRARNPEYVERERERARIAMQQLRNERLYGISEEEYVALKEAHEGRCAICSGLTDRLYVDHDHATGLVRGLLCRSCNFMVGLAGDSVERLMRAAEYLGRDD